MFDKLQLVEDTLRYCRKRAKGKQFSKNGFAPRDALLTSLWGDEPSSESSDFTCLRKRCVRHRSTVGSRVFDSRSPLVPSVVGGKESAFHTLFFQVTSV
jgi:hypothetical protein